MKYCIKRKSRLYPATLATSKRYCKKLLLNVRGGTWRQAEQDGWRIVAVKVVITEV
jgi:hypothetical protein